MSSPPGTPEVPLTPRSKIAALLADSDSDSDAGTPIKKSITTKPAVATRSEPAGRTLENDDNYDEEEEEEISRPRGKLAARMYGASSAAATKKNDGLSAYERVKADLLTAKDTATKTAQSASTKPTPPVQEDEPMIDSDAMEEGDDIQIAPRRRAQVGSSSPAFGSPVRRSPVASPKNLSPAPKPVDAMDEDDDSDDLPEDLTRNTKFLALVEKRRQERLAKEAQEAEEKAARQKKSEFQAELEKEMEESWDDDLKVRQALDDGELDGMESDERNDILNGVTKLPKGLGLGKGKKKVQRKAGKKAMEEMHKETQRIQRNMQLEHEARTRKKIAKTSLFEKFNFKAAGEEDMTTQEPVESVPKAPTPAAEPAAAIPTEESTLPDAPNSLSPPLATKPTTTVSDDDDDDDLYTLPTAADILANLELLKKPKPSKAPILNLDLSKSAFGKPKPKPKIDLKGKGRAIPASKLPPVKLKGLPTPNLADDSDSDLEIFDPNAPKPSEADEAKRLLNEKQKLIASLRRPRPLPKARTPADKSRSSLSAKQLHLLLKQKGRLQAIREREERIEELKARGVIVQTAEEREKEMMEVESLLEKARKEAMEIKRREQKEERIAKGENVSDEGEDWAEEGNEFSGSDDEGEEGNEFSGSDDEGEEGDDEEEEEGEDDEDMEEAETESVSNPLLDSAASEAEAEEPADDEMGDAPKTLKSPATPGRRVPLSSLQQETPRLSDMPDPLSDSDSDGGFAPFKLKKKLPRKKAIIADSDDEEEAASKTASTAVTPAKQKAVVNVPATQTPKPMFPMFGNNNAAGGSIGMSQLFAGSGMSPGMSGMSPGAPGSVGKKINAMRAIPDDIAMNSQAPGARLTQVTQPDIIPSSQPDEFGKISLDYGGSSQVEGADELPMVKLDYSNTQMEVPDPTQDAGFRNDYTPARRRFMTETPEPGDGMGEQEEEDPFMEKKPKGRRLVRRKAADFSDEEEEAASAASEAEKEEDEEAAAEEQAKKDAFVAMKLAAKKAKAKARAEAFDKSKSAAREMIDERAEESEDEYANLGGGPSEDEADLDDNDLDMPDLLDNSTQHIDHDSMAAFYAAREKAQDEKDVNRLFRDLQNGMLRKKRGAGFDLDDDSDDEYLQQERRRRMKRRQMAQIRQALLRDEKLGKIAQDPKKSAFFRVLQGEEEEEEDFLDVAEEEIDANLQVESQSQQEMPQEEAADPMDADVDPMEADAKEVPQDVFPGAKPDPRRPTKSKKPANLAQIRETLSFLGVEENTMIDLSSSDDEDDSQKRRTANAQVIDRSRTTITSTVSASAKLAFSTGPAGLRVPSLLRRATGSNLSVDSQDSVTTSTTERSLGDNSMKKGGAKSSSINFHTRVKTVGQGTKEKEDRKRREREKEVRERVKGRGLAGLSKGGFS
ncbi:MRC1-like domain-containing protein [Pyronema domesticum]|nr:MRC1-like domain-containing protein [Pyronema domesticum]